MAFFVLFSLFASFVSQAATSSIAHDLPARVIDPNHDTKPSAHGEIVSPDRIVLKLDCPACPATGEDQTVDSTSLIYDFAIERPRPSRYLGRWDGTHKISLNRKTIYPQAKPEYAPLVGGAIVPIPSEESIASYRRQPDRFLEAGLLGALRSSAVNNSYSLNMICLTLRTTLYGYGGEHMLDNDVEEGTINLIQLYIRKEPRSTSTRGGTGRATVVKVTSWYWTLEWWEIVPQDVFMARLGPDQSDFTVHLPPGLEDKLIANKVISPPSHVAPQIPFEKPKPRIGPWNVLQVWTLAAVVVLSLIGLAYVGTWVCKGARRALGSGYMSRKKGVLNLDDYAYLSEGAKSEVI